MGQRVLVALPTHVQVRVLTSNHANVQGFRSMGAVPLVGNLDQPGTLARLAGLAHRVLHLAPPANVSPVPSPVRSGGTGLGDARTAALLKALRRRTVPTALVYGSTSGVYGDCGGAVVSETRALAPLTARALRRIGAEGTVRQFGRATLCRVSVLRIPGIYAPNRVDGMPLERLRQAMPVLSLEDDVFTNHIHADDLARACLAALWRSKPQRVYNINDDTALRMGDYFDVAADLYRLPRPPRLSREAAAEQLSPLRLSFMQESRRMNNQRMKRELRVSLRYPTVVTGLVS